MSHSIHNVVRAIFDSYLSHRAAYWGQKEFDPDSLVKKEAKHKVSAIRALLNDIPKSNNSSGWTNFMQKLADLEAGETAAKNENLSRPFNLNLGWVAAKLTGEYLIQTDAELAKAARAAMSAIVYGNKESTWFTTGLEEERDELSVKKSELENRLEAIKKDDRKNRTNQKKAIEDIEKELKTTTNRYNAFVAAMTSNYQDAYFKDTIKAKDPRGLNETSFEDFCTNATNGTRKTLNLAKLSAGAAAAKAAESRYETGVAASSASTFGGDKGRPARKSQRDAPSTYSLRRG